MLKRYLQDSSVSIPKRTMSRLRHSTPIEEDASMEELDISSSSLTEIDSTVHDTDQNETDISYAASSDDEEYDDTDISTSFFRDENASAATSEPLYKGAPADLSLYMANLLLFKFYKKHSLTQIAFQEILHLIKAFLPSDAALPQSVKELKNFLVSHHKSERPTLQEYCSECLSLVDPDSTCTCTDGNKKHFVTVPLAPQIKARLEDPAVWKAITTRHEEPKDVMTDVNSGRKYKTKFSEFTAAGNVTLMANTDGMQLFKSSQVAMWPIWVTINELPVKIRFSKRNMILAGLWCSSEKPNMNMFLKPFITSANELYITGIEVSTIDGTKIVRAAIIGMSCDLPARALVLNMKQFNGKSSCHLCLDEGTTLPNSAIVRYWPYNSSQEMRSKDTMIQSARQSVIDGKPRNGVKGPTILSLHKPLDLCEGMLVDSLHCLFLGVSLKLLHLWVDAEFRHEVYSIRSKMDLCNQRLKNIQVPDRISRTPRPLGDFKRWKGSEHRSWLLYYSLPVMKNVLDDKYYDHLSLLISALHVLCSDSISADDEVNCEKWIAKFYQQYEEYYGLKHCTMNIHLLSHLANTVKNWGPLWAYSCFQFESSNNSLKKFFHGTRDMSEQMATTYVLSQVVDLKSAPYDAPSSPVQGIFNILSGHKSYMGHPLSKTIFILGSVKMKTLKQGEAAVIANYYEFLTPINTIPSFTRIRIKNTDFHSIDYTRVKLRNNYTILYSHTFYGQILFFTLHNNKPAAILRKLKVLPACENLPRQLVQVELSTELEVISPNKIEEKLIFIDTLNSSYAIRFPCSLNID